MEMRDRRSGGREGFANSLQMSEPEACDRFSSHDRCTRSYQGKTQSTFSVPFCSIRALCFGILIQEVLAVASNSSSTNTNHNTHI